MSIHFSYTSVMWKEDDENARLAAVKAMMETPEVRGSENIIHKTELVRAIAERLRKAGIPAKEVRAGDLVVESGILLREYVDGNSSVLFTWSEK